MANNRYYISLPPPAPATQKPRRPPLTPSTVSSPCLSTHTPSASRRDSGCGSPEKATSLLAKVVSHPATPRRGTPVSSPLPSPTPKNAELHTSPMESRPPLSRHESARYWYEDKKQDGYISFPDFENFRQSPDGYDGRNHSQSLQHTVVTT